MSKTGLEGEDLEAVFMDQFAKKKRGSTAARREKETRPISYKERRSRRAGKREQLNLDFRPGFKKRLAGAAEFKGLTMTATLEEAFELYVKHIGWGER